MREKEFLHLVKERFGIKSLNPMQLKMLASASGQDQIMLLSPTGSGKTLAFVLPVLKWLNKPSGRIQAVIIAPSRELVIQIGEVVRNMAPGYKVTTLYGGHNVEDETRSLSVVPDIVVSTPGRLLDHANRRTLDLLPVRIVVIDEYDKALELGFSDEMERLMRRMKNVSRFILTSATDMDSVPEYLPLKNPFKLRYLSENEDLRKRMRIHIAESSSKDKLESLLGLLQKICGEGAGRTIVFVNHRQSAERVAEYLERNRVDSVLYHGALDQRDREKAVAMFNNGSKPILVATDLASRGLDIEGVESVIHYHLPLTQESYIHRNGRTARVDREGDVYILAGPEEVLPDYVETDDRFPAPAPDGKPILSGLTTLYISAGKKEKVSKGDIAGYLIKECGLEMPEIGKINVGDHYSLVAVPSKAVREILATGKQRKLKGEKRKIAVAQ